MKTMERKNCQTLMLLIALFALFSSCNSAPGSRYTKSQKDSINNIIAKNKGLGQLLSLEKKYEKSKNIYGLEVVYRELGKYYRDDSKFKNAIYYHRKGLKICNEANDTLEMVKALNNLGTNYRRLGILTEATEYHYKALEIIEKCSKKCKEARKNLAMSLNGIGNIQLTLGNDKEAEKIFWRAHAVEKELNSNLGQAINEANIGAIYLQRGNYDVAANYFKESLKHNIEAKSTLGISLCYNSFGDIYEKKGDIKNAISNYQRSYDIMKQESDQWHCMEACIALVRANLKGNNISEAEKYLKLAHQKADSVQSLEHLSSVYYLDYLFYKQKREYQQALESFTKSRAYADSLSIVKESDQLQNIRVDYEKKKGQREMSYIKQSYESAQHNKHIILLSSVLAIILSLIIIGFLCFSLRMKNRMQQTMKDMERMRSNFFTNITHEFRTPLTVILGLARQMIQTEKDKEKEKNLSAIVRQGENLLNLVNQLLDISKLMSKVNVPRWYAGNVVSYVRMALESYHEYAYLQRINLVFKPHTSTIEMDFVPEYFNKILRNLISNALKYTPKGGTIQVEMSNERNELLLIVSDTGKGIATDDIGHVFETFYQGNNSMEISAGSGIGLSLVKQLVENMNGHIKVENQKENGAKFTIEIPIQHNSSIKDVWNEGIENHRLIESGEELMPKESEDEEKPHLEKGESRSTETPTILIVEDNADIAYYIGSLLKDNYHLLYASNGQEGLEVAKEDIPDLVITDLMMPHMDGETLCSNIRHSEILNHIPIIIITAKTSDKDRIAGFTAGADAYLQKPFNAEELKVRVNQLLEQRHLLREKFEKGLYKGSMVTTEMPLANKKFIERLTNYVQEQITNNEVLTSEYLANKMCMSLSQLNRKLNTMTGLSSSSFVLHLRMEKARRMLSTSDVPISDIAVNCGIDDAGYFTRVFKQLYHITPSQFRKQLHEK